jgi:hypothetical protein
MYTYLVGNSSGDPPWWFTHTAGSPGFLYTSNDLTYDSIYRNPSYGQISSLKNGVYGIRTKAAFEGSGSGSGFFLEAIYFSERPDWAGQREFGFFRNVADARVYFYWSINSNCSAADNRGHPHCRAEQATTDAQEYPAQPPLLPEGVVCVPIDNVDATKQYIWVAYVFWASWDSSYKFRVEMWDNTYTTQIAAFNVDTKVSTANFGATTSGMTGYVNLAAQRLDPFSASSGSQLSVSSVEIIH